MASHEVLLTDDQLVAECDVGRLRRGGPGGQHRNKVETAVRIEHRPTGVVAEANETRSQERNRREAIARLRLSLALSVRSANIPNADLAAIWHEHRRGDRMPTTANSKSGPSLAAHVFDELAEFHFDVGDAATALKVTKSQLFKFLKSNGQVWQALNTARAAAGLSPLHA